MLSYLTQLPADRAVSDWIPELFLAISMLERKLDPQVAGSSQRLTCVVGYCKFTSLGVELNLEVALFDCRHLKSVGLVVSVEAWIYHDVETVLLLYFEYIDKDIVSIPSIVLYPVVSILRISIDRHILEVYNSLRLSVRKCDSLAVHVDILEFAFYFREWDIDR